MAEAIEHEVDENLDVFLDVFRRIALVLVEMSHQFLLPGGQIRRALAPVPCCGATERSEFLGILSSRRRRRFRGRQFLRGRRWLRGLFGVVIDPGFLKSISVTIRVRLGGLRRRVLGQIGFLLDRLLLGKRGRGDGNASVSGPGGRSVASRCGEDRMKSNLDRRRAEIIGQLIGLHVSHRQRHTTEDGSRARRPLTKPKDGGTAAALR